MNRPLLILFIASLGGFLFGYNTGVISGALLFIAQTFSLSIFQEGMVVSILLIGALIGASVAGGFADKRGRRFTLLLNALVFIAGNILSAGAPSLFLLFAGRLLTGFAVGVVSIAAPLYLAEMAPPERRGAFVSANQLAITLGILAAYACNVWCASEANWRSMFAFGLLPALMQFFGMLLLPESPSWLHREKTHFSNWKGLLAPSLRLPLFVGIGLSIFQQITGINTVIYYAPKIFALVGSTALLALIATVGIGLVNVLATILSVWLMDKVGRRALLLTGIAGMTMGMATLAFAFFTHSSALNFLALLSLIGYVAFFAIGLGPVTWVILSEIYPLSLRGRAMGIATFANWLFNYIVSLTFLDLLTQLTPAGTFLLYALISLLSLYFVYRFIPETRGKTLAEIEASWRK